VASRPSPSAGASTKYAAHLTLALLHGSVAGLLSLFVRKALCLMNCMTPCELAPDVRKWCSRLIMYQNITATLEPFNLLSRGEGQHRFGSACRHHMSRVLQGSTCPDHGNLTMTATRTKGF
jgi:hypothetical protein